MSDSEKRKFRYVVKVVETIERETVVDSDVEMSWNDLEDIAEYRRTEGNLDGGSVKDVDMWCDAVYVDGVKSAGFEEFNREKEPQS